MTTTAVKSILLVDDDDSALWGAATLLEVLGYEVTAVDTADKALQVLREGAEVDLLITDLLMPRMNGIELSAQAARLRESLPVIYITGYSPDLISRNEAPLKGEVILKPWTVEQLQGAIERSAQRAP
jgi:CheY-like chemotaxis protein